MDDELNPTRTKIGVIFEDVDLRILERYAQEHGLGGKWLSAAVRQVIRAYDRMIQEHKDTTDGHPSP